MFKNILIILLVTQLSSCAVLHEEYFYPQANGAIVEKQWCRGKVGVDNQLIFQFDDVKVNLKVWEHKGITRLGVSFEVYEDARILWPKQLVKIDVGKSSHELKVDGFTRLRFKNKAQSNELLHKEYLVNSTMNRTTDEIYETYSNSFIITDKIVEKLEIRKIRVFINDKEHVLTEIFFTKKSGVFLHPLNC